MNPSIRKLTAIIIVMFLTLMAAISYIQFFKAPELNADARNVRTLWREFGTDRGPIIVAGEPIVTSNPSQMNTSSSAPITRPNCMHQSRDTSLLRSTP